MYTFIILFIIYIIGLIYTYHVCTPKDVVLDHFDHFAIPFVTVLWPVFWSWIILAEIIGWLRRKTRIARRRKKFDRK